MFNTAVRPKRGEAAMQKPRQPPSNVFVSPFFRLSQELRDMIYAYAIEPRAVFTYTLLSRADRDELRKSQDGFFCIPNTVGRGKWPFGIYDDRMEDPYVDDDNDDHDFWTERKLVDPLPFSDAHGLSARNTLYYRLSTFTPLLQVCQVMSAEVKHNLKRINRSIHALVKSSIYRGKCFINSPDQYFLDLCDRSRFEFTHDAKCSLGFLRRTPTVMRPYIRSIVIGGRTVYSTDPATWDLWAGYTLTRGTERAVFATRLLEFLPKLREVAVYVPNRYEGGRRYCHKASNEVCNMLEEGHVDVVRFLYTSSTSDPFFNPLHDCQVLKQVQFPSQKGRRSLYFDVLLLDHYLGNWDSDSIMDNTDDSGDDPIEAYPMGLSPDRLSADSESNARNVLHNGPDDDRHHDNESQGESSTSRASNGGNGSHNEENNHSEVTRGGCASITEQKRKKVKVDYLDLVVRSMRQFHHQAEVSDDEKRFFASAEETITPKMDVVAEQTSSIPFSTWPEPLTVIALRRKGNPQHIEDLQN